MPTTVSAPLLGLLQLGVMASVLLTVAPSVFSAEPAAEPQSKKGSAVKGPIPRKDPSDYLYRRAPMAESSRSIVIALSTNLHLAFDTHLLRTHTVWNGGGLNLFGTPFHGSKTPFLCTRDGDSLWTLPPTSPWHAGSIPARDLSDVPEGSRFRAVEFRDGGVALEYEIGLEGRKTVKIVESARPASAEESAVVRRFEVGASDLDLWFLAHSEMGDWFDQKLPSNAIAIRRSGDLLISAVSGSIPLEWHTQLRDVSYEIALNAEKGGESELRKEHVEGRQARAYLKIPKRNVPVVFEVVTFTSDAIATPAKLNSMTHSLLSVKKDPKGRTIKKADSTSQVQKQLQHSSSMPSRGNNDEFYTIEHFPIPKELELGVTGMDWLPDGRLAVCTWLGEIYLIEGATGPIAEAKYSRFAHGLCEPLGLKVIDGAIYVVQKPEITRILDQNGDGEADRFETVTDRWGYTGNYHAFAFGPAVSKKGELFAFLCGQRGKWETPFVGWAVRASQSSPEIQPFCSGLRAANGFGTYGSDMDLFVTENQGNWVGACKLNHLQEGKFYGYPSGIPASKPSYGTATNFFPPAVWFPRKLAPSVSGFESISDSRFGPFEGQMLVGDFQNAVVLRVFLEKVNGEWQGSVWPFAKGFHSGVNRLRMGKDGKLYVGGVENSAWPSAAPREYSLDRLSFTGKIPFEVQKVNALANGFKLTFTKPVNAATAADVQNYFVSQFNYKYHSTYGSPEFDFQGKPNSSSEIPVIKASVSEDRKVVTLTLADLRDGYVTGFQITGITSDTGEEPWHDSFYYTLNQRPNADVDHK